jgi:hypothetical protein
MELFVNSGTRSTYIQIEVAAFYKSGKQRLEAHVFTQKTFKLQITSKGFLTFIMYLYLY